MPAESSRWRMPLLALLLGVLHALSFAPWRSAVLQLLSLAGLLLLVWRTAPQRRSRLLAGWLFGLGWFVSGLCWLYISMHDYGGMPAPIAALAVLLFAGYLAIWPALALALAAPAAGRRAGLRQVLVLAGAWTLSEWLRGLVFTGFPWLAIGYAQVDSPLAGWAPVLGVYGVCGLTALVAGALAATAAALWPAAVGGDARPTPSALPARPPVPAWRSAAPAALLALLVAGAGALLAARDWTTPLGAPISVRLVQGNIPQEMKFSPAQIKRSMALYASLVAAGRADITVLPETAWTLPWPATPDTLVRQMFPDGQPRLVAIGMPMLAAPRDGATMAGNQAAADQLAPQIANSMVLIDGARSGTPLAQYDKQHLVPFGEFIPWGFGWFVQMMNIPLGEFARGGRDQRPFEVAGQRLAMNICYEDLFGEELLPPLRHPQGASILVNASNIGWFGDSHALPQHLAISRMRAIETGRPMLRATNTGVTASIDARGRVVAQLPPYTVGVLEDSVQGMQGLTPYARFGNLPALLLAMLALAAGLLGRRNR